MTKVSTPHSNSSTSLGSSLKDSQGKGFDPKEIIVLERWQDYVYFGVMFITACTLAKRVLSGNVSSTLSNSMTLGTVVMGKIYTDNALDKYSLGKVAQSMEKYIYVLQHQNDIYTKQLEENRGQLARLGLENNIYTKNNVQHKDAVLETRRILREYADQLRDYNLELDKHKEAVRRIELEISEGNREKERLTKELDERRQQLAVVTDKINHAADRLSGLT